MNGIPDSGLARRNKISYRVDGLNYPYFEICVRIIAMARKDYHEGDDAERYSAATFFQSKWYEMLYDYCSSCEVMESYLECLKPPKGYDQCMPHMII